MKQAFWILLLLAIGFVTASFQLDRQSRISPDLAGHVPPFARYFSQPEFVSRAFRSGPSEWAVAESKVLVERRPVPAEHLRILSQAQLAAGDIEAGTISIQLAARRGWRDRQTQEAMAELAMFAGAPEEAANRLAALIARHEDSEAIAAYADATFGQVTGRDRMAEILASDPRWKKRFFRVASPHLENDTLRDLLLAAHERGARFECERVKGVADRLGSADASLAPLLKRNCAD